MNVSDLSSYLRSGLDPTILEVVDTPYMRVMENWIPDVIGMVKATALPNVAHWTIDANMRGRAPMLAIGSTLRRVMTMDNYTTRIATTGESFTDYTNNHRLCCDAQGVLFFADPKPGTGGFETGRSDASKRLYDSSPFDLFWCGIFNEALGVITKSDLDFRLPLGDSGLDHFKDFTSGQITFKGRIEGIHALPEGRLVVCTEDGLQLVSPMQFERFTFGAEKVTSDKCKVPHSINATSPLLVNTEGEALIVSTAGIQKIGYRRQLAGIADGLIHRVTYHEYKNTYYICTANDTFVLNDLGLWLLKQQVITKTDVFSVVGSGSGVATALAETVPFSLEVEGVKNLKGVLLESTGAIQVSFGFRESENAIMQYTPWMSPDSRGAVNKVVTGCEFSIRFMSSAANASISKVAAVWSNAVKTNFSQSRRRL